MLKYLQINLFRARSGFIGSNIIKGQKNACVNINTYLQLKKPCKKGKKESHSMVLSSKSGTCNNDMNAQHEKHRLCMNTRFHYQLYSNAPTFFLRIERENIEN